MSENINLLNSLIHDTFDIVDLTHSLEEGIPSCGTHALAASCTSPSSGATSSPTQP